MRMISAAWLSCVLAFTPAAVSAQTVRSFDDLPRRIAAGSRLRVEDTGGKTADGRLTRLSAEEIALETATGEQRFARDTVSTVAVRRGSGWIGTLIGAGAGAAIGGLMECRGGEHAECGEGLVMIGLLGAGVGAISGALIPRMQVVYRSAGREALVVPEFTRGSARVTLAVRW